MTEDTNTEEPAENKENIAKTTMQHYLLKERFEICFDQPLPKLNSNGAIAYEVKDNINPQRNLFALICGDETSPRLSYLPYLKSIDSPYILKLIEYGTIKTPSDKESMALIYNKPTGPKANIFEANAPKISFDTFKSLSLSLLSACDSLKTFGVTHRAIRLDNVFYKDPSCKEIVLGDCLASFPSMYQPDVYETIENTLCSSYSRGNGFFEHDRYAAGVVLLGITLNHDITSELSKQELVRQKLRYGSFNFLSNNEKINSQIAFILKSLLDDNGENRCDYTRLYNYYEGKTQSLFSAENDRSTRALNVGGEKCYTAESVAVNILSDINSGLELLQNGKLLEWIKTGLEKEKLYAKIEKQIQAEKENPDKHMLLNKICTFLDSSLPLKYGDDYMFPEGLAKTLFYYKKNNLSLTPIQTLISSDIIKIWYQEQPSLRAPSNAGEFRAYLSRSDYGYGFDRIMYDNDEDLPCISPLLGNVFVNSASRLLKALDKFKGDHQTLPFDKNIIAYLRCKMGKKIDGILIDLNANQDHIKLGAIIRLYANIQNKHGPAQLTNLSQWLVSISKPLIQSYHNLKYQKYLEQELLQVSKTGKIIDIVNLLENDEARDKDKIDYSEALKNANFLLTEKSKIISGDAKLEEEAKDLAMRFSSIIAVLTMLSALAFSLIYWIIK